jgi:penicillin-binding protein 2
VYPPGSTFKLITASAALEEHIINPLARLFDAGDIIVQNFYAPNDRAADQRFVCWKRDGHGYIDMEGAIANSCNVYFYQVGGGNRALSEQLLRPNGVDIENLFRYATALGIGSELGVELPGELAGRMPDRDWKRITQGENWSTGDTYNAAVGQGYINVTPLQLITAISAIVNNGTIYQPTLVREYLDAERNITRAFSPTVLRTVNLENVGADGVLALFLLEDMIIQGPTSLACTCEENSSYFNPSRCNPQGYRAQVDIVAGFEEDIREYRVQIPDQYTFNGNVCESNRWDSNYVPAFISTETMNIIRRGMRRAVTEGTATPSNLSYITVAGKTGTAEYCDNIAGPLGLCIPGNWPSHAWYAAYAPYENPEILILAFVYNGDEGSSNALPVTVETMEAYVRLRNERENQAQPDSTVLNSP